jgi:hypothetical protein
MLASAADDRRGTIGFGRNDAETPGGYSRDDEDAVDLAMVENMRLILPSMALEKLERMTTSMLQYRRMGNVSTTAVLRAAIDDLLRANMSSSGTVRDAVVPPQSGSAGGFTFNVPAAVSVCVIQTCRGRTTNMSRSLRY